MTRADFDKAIGLVSSGSQAHQVCNEYIKSLEAELEALQQPKNNCDTCKWDDYCGTEENCLSSKYIKDRYESK